MFYTLDRFEEQYAILEDRQTNQMIEVLKTKISDNAKPGDILKLVDEKYVVDNEKTNNQKQHIKELMEKLKKK